METSDEYIARKAEEFKEQFRRERLEELKRKAAEKQTESKAKGG